MSIMHISNVSLVNYRNFRRATVELKPGINTIIGENGSGKTNLFRAIRLLLDENMVAQANKLDEKDFNRGLDDWRGHWIVIKLEFSGVSSSETIQSLLLQNVAVLDDNSSDIIEQPATYSLIFRPNDEKRNKLSKLSKGDHEGLKNVRKSITIDDYETIHLGRGTADIMDEEEYKRIVGDFEEVIFPDPEEFTDILGIRIGRYFSLTREFSFSYIDALRDVQREFHRNHRNPLRTLLSAKSEDVDLEDFQSVVYKVKELNEEIENRNDIKYICNGIYKTFKQTVGETYSATSMSVKSELPTEADELFRSLKLYVGEHGDMYEGGINELSLGTANLLFITLKLLEFQYKKAYKPVANFLLIEEPEAHIHTHIQKTLFNKINYDDTQIIYSTHSPQISEVSAVDRVNILGRRNRNWEVYQPWKDLSTDKINRAQRFLDAIRCNLLFARGVILVEGDAEEILIPHLIKEVYGVSLDELGVSLINVRSTAFENLANLFHKKRIQKRCAIVTDLDSAFINLPTCREEDDKGQRLARNSDESGRNRKNKYEEYAENNDYVHAFYAEHTFEVDFAKTDKDNRRKIALTINDIYSRGYEQEKYRRIFSNSNDITEYGKAVLNLADREGKGWFALLLSDHIDYTTVVPSYILDALAWVLNGKVSHEIMNHIKEWRAIKCHKDSGLEIDDLIFNKLKRALSKYAE